MLTTSKLLMLFKHLCCCIGINFLFIETNHCYVRSLATSWYKYNHHRTDLADSASQRVKQEENVQSKKMTTTFCVFVNLELWKNYVFWCCFFLGLHP